MHPQLTLNLDPGQSLDFAAFWGGENALLVDVLIRFASTQSQDTQVYIHGNTGLGKTHLLTATCQRATEQGYRIAYLPAQLIDQPAELDGYDRYDLVCIDDLQQLGRNSASELALFGLINGLRQHGGRLLLSANCNVMNLKVSLPDLATRLGWGATYKLTGIPDDQIADALAMRAENLGVNLPREVIDFLLARHSRDFASLIELLGELKQASMRAKRKITIPFVREVLADH